MDLPGLKTLKTFFGTNVQMLFILSLPYFMWFQAMVHELIGIKDNKVTLKESSKVQKDLQVIHSILEFSSSADWSCSAYID